MLVSIKELVSTDSMFVSVRIGAASDSIASKFKPSIRNVSPDGDSLHTIEFKYDDCISTLFDNSWISASMISGSFSRLSHRPSSSFLSSVVAFVMTLSTRDVRKWLPLPTVKPFWKWRCVIFRDIFKTEEFLRKIWLLISSIVSDWIWWLASAKVSIDSIGSASEIGRHLHRLQQADIIFPGNSSQQIFNKLAASNTWAGSP